MKLDSPSLREEPLGVAADLMCENVTPIAHYADFGEAISLLIDHNLSVVPVTGEFGEPIGVLSLIDLLIHVRECLPTGRIAPVSVDQLMTPTVFTVSADTSLDEIARDMLQTHVHHMFVTDEQGEIAGVLNAADLLKAMSSLHHRA